MLHSVADFCAVRARRSGSVDLARRNHGAAVLNRDAVHSHWRVLQRSRDHRAFVYSWCRAGKDLAAKLQLVELIVFLPVVFLLIGRFGITGAAVAYVARMVFNSLLMLWLSHRLMR